MKTYKGFSKDMTCLGFQYEEGKEYEEEEAKAGVCGFHACKYPLDCFNSYPPNTSIFHEVEQNGEINQHKDGTKIASTKIKIGAEISIVGLVKASIEYTTKRVNSKAKSNQNHGASTSTESHGTSSTTGNCGVSSATGDGGTSSTTGDYGASSATGDGGVLKLVIRTALL